MLVGSSSVRPPVDGGQRGRRDSAMAVQAAEEAGRSPWARGTSRAAGPLEGTAGTKPSRIARWRRRRCGSASACPVQLHSGSSRKPVLNGAKGRRDCGKVDNRAAGACDLDVDRDNPLPLAVQTISQARGPAAKTIGGMGSNQTAGMRWGRRAAQGGASVRRAAADGA